MNVSEKLRLVYGLHSHAEMFGFNWDDDSNWTWHDVTCKIADEIDAENAKLRELVQILVHCLNDVDCDKCLLNDNPYELRGEWAACDALLDRIRELGIEVD